MNDRPGTTRHRPIIEEDAQPPLDLRLLFPAVAAWGGSLVTLCAGSAVGWITAGVAVLFSAGAAGLILVPGRRSGHHTRLGLRVWRAVLPAALFLAAGSGIAALRIDQANRDPVHLASVAGQWVQLTVTVSGDPQPMVDPFVAGSSSARRYLVHGTATEVSLPSRGPARSSRAAITLFVTGTAWAAVLPGQSVRVAGRGTVDDRSVIPAAMVTVTGPPITVAEPPWWQRWAGALRVRFAAATAGLEPEQAGLLPGIVLGDTRGLSRRLTADARVSGLAHLLAVSGSHFTVLCGMLLVVLRRIGPRAAGIGAGVVVLALVVIVRPGPSVLRAAVMGSVAVLALLIGRSRSALPALAAAVVGLLWWDPALATDPGFALSVLATLGIVLVSPVWSKALRRRGIPAGWADLLVLPVVAQLATMPVITMISGSISVWSVPANLLVSPVVAPLLILGVLTALVATCWPDGGAGLGTVLAPLGRWIAGVAHTVAARPNAVVTWPSSVSGAVVLAVLIVVTLLLMRHRRWRAFICALVVGFLVIIVPAQVITLGWPPQGWLLIACEVGQGDGLVLSTGRPGEAVVIDTGPDPVLMDRCLDRLGITTVPLVVLTHLHADHIDGLSGVLDGRAVAAVGVGPGREPAQGWDQVLASSRAAGVPITALTRGTSWTVGPDRLDILGPVAVPGSTHWGPNDQSVVIRATIGSTRILLTGDVEVRAQQALLDAGTDLHADVLKVPHHGSAKLLPAFVDRIGAAVGVIGVGLGNDFGHPSPSALHLLAASGIGTVLRTDLDGDVAVCLDGGRLSTVMRGTGLPEAR
ncbi:ComEC/Rec2 family competence protein [Nakamurella silvestris]|nr:ComEC/Rec2 family competence protein [Nakamurella silvestris]